MSLSKLFILTVKRAVPPSTWSIPPGATKHFYLCQSFWWLYSCPEKCSISCFVSVFFFFFFFQFCSSSNNFFFWLYLSENLHSQYSSAGYRILGWKSFSFRTLKLLFQWPLAFTIAVGNSESIQLPNLCDLFFFFFNFKKCSKSFYPQCFEIAHWYSVMWAYSSIHWILSKFFQYFRLFDSWKLS